MSKSPVTSANRQIPLILNLLHQCVIVDGKETHTLKVRNSILMGTGETIEQAENNLARKLSDELNGF